MIIIDEDGTISLYQGDSGEVVISGLDSDEDYTLKKEYLKESYSEIFGYRGGLGNFIINEEDDELRDKLNVEFLDNVDKIRRILNSL